jgi:polyisoprenoid-binding protein YceI
MKHITIILLAWMSIINQAGQDLYVCKNAKLSIFSSAPIEDISAETTTGTSVYNPASGDLVFSINIRSLTFPKSLMQEHFNTDYMESDKYPKATFKGKVQQPVDVTKNGVYAVSVVGDLEVHGVKQTRTIAGSITVNNGAITITSEFMVKCADHKIDIPRLVFHNIAESIKVNISATYASYKTSNTTH